MKVTQLEEQRIQSIGHAFGYYDYGDEKGLVSCYRDQEAAAIYINGYVRMALKGGILYTTSENKEAYIAYSVPGQKIGLRAGMELLKALFRSMSLKEMIHFFQVMGKGGPDLKSRMDKEKKKYIFVGLVCVTEPYQGQGYMRKAMELAFAEGNRLRIPVILDTDAKSKCDKYMHLGMELVGTRNLPGYGKIYELAKYPDE